MRLKAFYGWNSGFLAIASPDAVSSSNALDRLALAQSADRSAPGGDQPGSTEADASPLIEEPVRRALDNGPVDARDSGPFAGGRQDDTSGSLFQLATELEDPEISHRRLGQSSVDASSAGVDEPLDVPDRVPDRPAAPWAAIAGQPALAAGSGAVADSARHAQRSESPTAPALAGAATAPAGLSALPSSTDLDPEITYVSGITASGTVAATSWSTWQADNPATYNATQSAAFKWGSADIGTAGGEVDYYFDPTSSWSAAEQHAFRAAFALWAAVANIDFVEVTTASDTDINITRGTGGAVTTTAYYPGTIGSTQAARPVSGQITVSINTGNNGFGPILDPATVGAFERKGGYPYDTIVHELGHAIGLGHGGAYNAGDGLGPAATRQFSRFDSRLWTLMSYIRPTDTGASFYSSYDVTGTRWGNVRDTDGVYKIKDPFDNGLYEGVPTTPMQLDILAVQRLYGSRTTGPLNNGHHVFGFNCNIAGDLGNFFNFEINRHPVVTVWATGPGNWLDLSGWDTPATIDITRGAFCSANGMVNNIGIGGGIQNVRGGNGDDTITGNNDQNTIYGMAGNDTINGGAQFDTLTGGTGNDVYLLYDYNNGYDTVIESTLSGGGTDAIFVKYFSYGPSSYTLQDGIENGALTDPGANGFTLNGNSAANQLFDDIGSNTLNGLAGNDFIDAGAGNDTLDGGAGADTLAGSLGDDVYLLYDLTNGAFDTVKELAGQGTDTVLVMDTGNYLPTYTMTANVEIGAVVGHDTNYVTLIGNSLDNTLYDDFGWNTLDGGAGDDTIIPGAGFDDLRGGTGDDSFQLADRTYDNQEQVFAYDSVGENAGAGNDFVYVTALHDGYFGQDFYAMTANVEGAELLGTIDFDLYGNDGNNSLYGNSAINALSGLGGDDTLFYSGGGFQGGGDTLDGGAGSDTASFANETAAVTASLAAGSASGGSGTDTLVSIENLIGGGGDDRFTGDGNANRLYGGGGSDILTGGAGADYMNGGLGDDAYDVDTAGDVVVEGLHAGTDYVTAAISYTLGANVENLTLYGYAGSINGTGNTLANVVIGNRGNNVLRGLDGNDYLFGGDLGDDTLDGGVGADTMDGGAGNDLFHVDNVADKVIEAVGGGSDSVRTTVSYALRAGAEIEVLQTNDKAGTAAIDLTGNEFDQTLYGNAGNNIIDGKGGQDVMVGFGGNDVFYVGNAADRVTEAAGGGTDQVRTTVSYALQAGSEIEVLQTTNTAGTGALHLTGNELSQTLTGNAGANVLDGGGGADVMVGLVGNDIYHVDNAADRVTEAAGGGTDQVLSSVNYILQAGQAIEVLATANSAATTAINLTGNAFAQTLTGNAGNNILNGGAGADTMSGLGGSDIYYVDSVADKVIEAAGGGTDQVRTSLSYTLGAGQEIETFLTTDKAGTTAINLTGNQLAQTLYGNAGNNVIDGKGGKDILVGYGGNDIFRFSTTLGATNLDRITDYSVSTDSIQIDNAVFTGLAAGALSANAFFIGAAAHDADDRIIYNSSNGALFFDSDGTGAHAAVQFATLSTGLAMTAGEFTVV